MVTGDYPNNRDDYPDCFLTILVTILIIRVTIKTILLTTWTILVTILAIFVTTLTFQVTIWTIKVTTLTILVTILTILVTIRTTPLPPVTGGYSSRLLVGKNYPGYYLDHSFNYPYHHGVYSHFSYHHNWEHLPCIAV